MSKICQITGKKAMIGNNVSHSKRRTKRTFDLNLFNKKFYYVEQDCWISLSICANGLRILNSRLYIFHSSANMLRSMDGIFSFPSSAIQRIMLR
jgi:large subunit ribosomal protein L28